MNNNDQPNMEPGLRPQQPAQQHPHEVENKTTLGMPRHAPGEHHTQRHDNTNVTPGGATGARPTTTAGHTAQIQDGRHHNNNKPVTTTTTPGHTRHGHAHPNTSDTPIPAREEQSTGMARPTHNQTTHQPVSANNSTVYINSNIDETTDSIWAGDSDGEVGSEEDGGQARPPLTPLQYRPYLEKIWPHTQDVQWTDTTGYHDIYTQVRKTALPNYMEARIPIPSGLNIPAWRELLAGYHDNTIVDYLEFGWPADYTGHTPPTATSGNHKEDPAHTTALNNYVDTELKHGALLGPFDAPPFTPWFQTSPMMTRPKKNTTERRVIVDLSWPKGESVNTGIAKGYYQGSPRSYTLPNIMDAADEVTRIGTGSYLWCADLARAYRQLRTCPLSTPLLGISLNNKHYIDIALPFGCRTSSLACARTTNAVVYLLRKAGHFVHCYLDDFVGMAPTENQAHQAYNDFKNLTRTLGLDLSPSKCTPPTKTIEWLGFNLSAQKMTVTIPKDKLDQVLQECQEWMVKRTATRKEIQRLAGKLHHIARCIIPARRFMSRIFDTLRDTPRSCRHNITDEFCSDVR